jgi:hypothetical protein
MQGVQVGTGLDIGSIVTHSDPYHCRGTSTGVIESILSSGWYQVWWEEDCDNQITPAFRTYEAHELLNTENQQLRKVSDETF